jgi:hypothetical protein
LRLAPIRNPVELPTGGFSEISAVDSGSFYQPDTGALVG